MEEADVAGLAREHETMLPLHAGGTLNVVTNQSHPFCEVSRPEHRRTVTGVPDTHAFVIGALNSWGRIYDELVRARRLVRELAECEALANAVEQLQEQGAYDDARVLRRKIQGVRREVKEYIGELPEDA